MQLNYFIQSFLLLICTTQSFSFNVLFVSVGYPGHVTPLIELAKGMKNHNVTFVTAKLAEFYINLNALSSASFHVVYANNSPDALVAEKKRELELISAVEHKSILESTPYIIPMFAETISLLLNKTIEILMNQKFDVIISAARVFGVPILCQKMNIPCVVHNPNDVQNLLNFNLPNIFSLATANDLTSFSSRLYNVAFILHMMMKSVWTTIPASYAAVSVFPRVPGPFYDSFTVKSLFFAKPKCLHLFSTPIRFYIPRQSTHVAKYLGVFIDDTPVDNQNDDLGAWLTSKPLKSVVYGTFGSTSIIPYYRMYNLIHGLANFLLQTNDSSLLLAFRTANFRTYQAVINDLKDQELQDVLKNTNRVRIEEGFVQQKWILQQSSVKFFLSHCGMGSLLESIYFGQPLLCMPFNMEQFTNALTVEALNIGKSLFEPPSAWELLRSLANVVKYNFTAESVTNKVLAMWTSESYEHATQEMSLEMKYAGGVKQAVKEIEFYVALNGDTDRFTSFESTLPWYQYYMLDLFLIYVLTPATIMFFIMRRCCRISKKQKRD